MLEPTLEVVDIENERLILKRAGLSSYDLPLTGGGLRKNPILSDFNDAIEPGCSQSGYTAFARNIFLNDDGEEEYSFISDNIDEISIHIKIDEEKNLKAKFNYIDIRNQKKDIEVNLAYLRARDVNERSPDFYKYIYTASFEEDYEFVLN